MKIIKWKTLCITCLVCLLPILLGTALWHDLPDTLAIHFDIYGRPDNFASRGFVVFGIPAFMMLLQMFCCTIHDINAYKKGERKKFERVVKWIIPTLTVILQIITLGYSLGMHIDIRRTAVVLLGLVFLAVGNYLPKFDYMPKLTYINYYNIDTEKAKKVNRFIGFETVIMGILAIISCFFPPMASVIWVCLLIPYTALGVLYGIWVCRKK